MAKRKTPAKRRASKTNQALVLSRGIWKGSISFGLVNVPVQLFSSRDGEQLSFNMLDKRDHSRIGYKQINKSTGKEISRSQIVKGYEYEKNEYVIVSETDFEKANPKATRTIDIEDFVDLDQIDVIYFDKPYYVVPNKGAEKTYALLREVLEKTKKAGIAKVVLHRKQHLAALIVRGGIIVLEILRFADQVLDVNQLERLAPQAAHARITEKELSIAEQLVEGMSSDWEPAKYRDTYQEDLKRLIESKIRSGNTATVKDLDHEPVRTRNEDNVVDLTALLRKSLQSGGKTRRHS